MNAPQGIDFRPRSDGAVRFGGWLRAQAPDDVNLLGVHALEQDDDRYSNSREQVQVAVEETLGRAGVRAAFDGVEVTAPDRPLQRAAHAAGFIIGRRTTADSGAIIRLGSVARRMLRRLVAPTFVVPPELEAEKIGTGPIVVAVTPDDASAAGARRAIGRRRMNRKGSAVLQCPLVNQRR